MYPALQLGKPPDSAYEINTLVRLRILDAKHRPQHQILQERDVESLHRIAVCVPGFQGEKVPLLLQEQGDLPLPAGMGRFRQLPDRKGAGTP